MPRGRRPRLMPIGVFCIIGLATKVTATPKFVFCRKKQPWHTNCVQIPYVTRNGTDERNLGLNDFSWTLTKIWLDEIRVTFASANSNPDFKDVSPPSSPKPKQCQPMEFRGKVLLVSPEAPPFRMHRNIHTVAHWVTPTPIQERDQTPPPRTPPNT